MTKHEYKQTAYYLIYLIRCVLNDKVPAQEKLDKMNLSQLFEVAQRHTLTAICAYALESAGIYDKAFTETKNKAIRKNIILDAEREKVFAEFEKAGIWYMPLKGSILKDYYPKIGMRQMADNDVLFDPSKIDSVRIIMEDLGFNVEHFGYSNHDVYFKPPVCNFEMHNELFLPRYGETIYEYYSNIKDKLIKDRVNNYGYHLNGEDYYVYITAHEYKHFYQGGTGLRNLVDRYVFLNKFSDCLDMTYIENELSKTKIAEYERNARNLSFKLFNGEKLNDDETKLLEYYVLSGTYGTFEKNIENQIIRNGGGAIAKIKYFATRFFGPISKKNALYKSYAAEYPLFYKHKLLLLILPFYRLGRALIKSRKRIVTEIKTLIKS